MYKSPIEMLMTDIQHQIVKQQEDAIYKAVVNVGVNVDKEELIRALQYDRGQYEKGYRDGLNAILRCRECQHFGMGSCNANLRVCTPTEDDYCSWAERRNDGNQA